MVGSRWIEDDTCLMYQHDLWPRRKGHGDARLAARRSPSPCGDAPVLRLPEAPPGSPEDPPRRDRRAQAQMGAGALFSTRTERVM